MLDPFGRFYRDNLHMLRAYVARLLPGSGDAEDIASEAFVRVFAATTPERPVPPRAYLYTAAHNLAMNQHRWRRVRATLDMDDEAMAETPDPAPGADRDLIARQRLVLLWEALDQLSPRTRQVFVMRKIERLTNNEIAERLGISVSGVEKHVLKGLRSCRAYLELREDCNAPVGERERSGGRENGSA
ncbi:RNA polymerase sigma factor [Sphingosinicella rhizophila]|uniref:RNA polymerase sigma factor n=1 Tax=Sphingosinicella rhizophila TaxID=3050082 RepID=A0ABU3QBD1_9SPHN|nr:RNA polymerase sigma factor [Sphingosinicella sp. GR2756]MDT9600627.1 RNA polymerase sigma factor [Sphingosinicella sp. GR2756]